MSQVLKICEQTDLVANSGVCAIVEGQQIALFYLPKEIPTVYAIGNWDPIGKANVLSRGMVGDINQRLVVASPLYKQHFDLQTGNCIEDSTMSVPVYHVELVADEVLVTL
jgi:nitrite reductase (NADH) small subunit